MAIARNADEDFRFIGIDIGGSKILGIITDDQGTPCFRKSKGVGESIKVNLAEVICSFAKEFIGLARDSFKRIVGIGVSIASALDESRSRLLFSPSYPQSIGTPLRSILQDRLGYPVVLENDLNAAAWGEKCCGNGRGYNNFYMITVGTGCGGSFICGGDIYRGLSGVSLLGHVTFFPKGGPQCSCGNTGCIQSVLSGTAIARMARDAIEKGRELRFLRKDLTKLSDITSEDVFAAAYAGDRVALEIARKVGRSCGLVVSDIIHLLCPDAVIIGGGVAQAGPLFFDTVREAVRTRMLVEAEKRCEILPAGLGPDAGAIGAAMLAARECQLEDKRTRK